MCLYSNPTHQTVAVCVEIWSGYKKNYARQSRRFACTNRHVSITLVPFEKCRVQAVIHWPSHAVIELQPPCVWAERTCLWTFVNHNNDSDRLEVGTYESTLARQVKSSRSVFISTASGLKSSTSAPNGSRIISTRLLQSNKMSHVSQLIGYTWNVVRYPCLPHKTLKEEGNQKASNHGPRLPRSIAVNKHFINQRHR